MKNDETTLKKTINYLENYEKPWSYLEKPWNYLENYETSFQGGLRGATQEYGDDFVWQTKAMRAAHQHYIKIVKNINVINITTKRFRQIKDTIRDNSTAL